MDPPWFDHSLYPVDAARRPGSVWNVGRRAAFRVLTAWLAERNGMIRAKERSLQEIWRKYQSVAHLWAAYHIAKIFPKSEDDLICYLAVGDHIRQLGEDYRLGRSKETLLGLLPVLVHVEIASRLSHRDATLLDQSYRLNLELTPKLPSLHLPPPAS